MKAWVLSKNEFVVVIGASGNTGVFALQFAKMLDANTIATTNSFFRER